MTKTKLKFYFEWLPQAVHHHQTPATFAGVPAPKQRAWNEAQGFLEFKSPAETIDAMMSELHKNITHNGGVGLVLYPIMWVTYKRVFLATTRAAQKHILQIAADQRKRGFWGQDKDYYPSGAAWCIDHVKRGINLNNPTLQKNLINSQH
jgi:hypothetical protein